MGGRWYRSNDNIPHPDHPERPPLKDIAHSPITAAGGELYTLYLLRWDDPFIPERAVAYLGGAYTGDRGYREHAPYTVVSDVIDLFTAEEFSVSSAHKDVAARKLKVSELPDAVRRIWPLDEKGRPVRPGFHDDSAVMGVDVLRRIAGCGEPSSPAQPSLFAGEVS